MLPIFAEMGLKSGHGLPLITLMKRQIRTFSALMTALMLTALGLTACTGNNSRNTIGLTRGAGAPSTASAQGPVRGILPDAVCPMGDFGLTGRVYYYCDCPSGSAGADCRPGSDVNEGRNTDPALPARSIDLAFTRFNKLQAGEKIALCRGGVFTPRAQTRLFNAACAPGKRCGIIDYVSPAAKSSRRPMIKTRGHGLIFSNPGSSARDGGYFTRNLNLSGSGRENSAGVLVYNDAHDINMCGLRVEGFHTGVRVGGFIGPPVSGNGLSERITLRNSELINNTARGWSGGGSDFVVRDNYFYNNGHGMPERYAHSIYVSGNYGSKAIARRMVVSGNRIEKNAHSPGGGCVDSAIAVHGRHDGLLIEANRIAESRGSAGKSCRGITVAPAYDTPELLRNIVVRRNRIEFVGGASVFTRACENCDVRENKVLSLTD